MANMGYGNYDAEGNMHASEHAATVADVNRHNQQANLAVGNMALNAALAFLGKLPMIATVCVFLLLNVMPKWFTRVWQSIVFAFFAYGVTFQVFLSLLPRDNTELVSSLELGGTLCWIILGIIALWFFIFHYRAVCCAGMTWFSAINNLVTILIFGSILMFVLRIPFKFLRHDAITMGVPYVLGVIYYFIQMWPCEKNAWLMWKNKVKLQNVMHDALWNKDDGMVWEILDDLGFIKVILWILTIIGFILLCFALWLEIFVPLGVSLLNLPIQSEFLEELGMGKNFNLLMPVALLLISVIFFLTMKFKWHTLFVVIPLISLLGFYPIICAFMDVQAFPNAVYDVVKLQPPSENIQITTTGERGRIYTLTRNDTTIIFTAPTRSKRIREEITVNKGETITTTGRLAEDGKWAEVRYKGETYWTLNPASHGRTTWTMGRVE